MFQHVTLAVAGFSKLFFSHGLGDRWYIVYGFFFFFFTEVYAEIQVCEFFVLESPL